MGLSRHFWQRYVRGAFPSLGRFLSALLIERGSQEQNYDAAARFFQTVVDGIIFDAPDRLRFPQHMVSEEGLRQGMRADYQHVDPRLMAFAATFIEVARQQGIPLYVHNAFRTKDHQNRLKAKGVSHAEWPRAPHAVGLAVDIVHGKFHWEMTDDEWALLTKIGKDVAEAFRTPTWEIRAGADFIVNGKPWPDPAHWEVLQWRNHVRPLAAASPIHVMPRAILRRGVPKGNF